MKPIRGRLSGKTAVVTGGGKGIGKAIVMRLAQEGAWVSTCGRDIQALEQLRREFNEAGIGGGISVICADVSNPRDVAAFFEAFRSRHDHLDILVNNVGGVRQFGVFDELDESAWLEVLEVNLMTTVRVTKAALPLLLASGNASVVNIASVAGVQAGTFNCHYGAAKAAQIQLTKYLANNYGERGIRANAVAMTTVRGGVWERDVQKKAHMDGTNVAVAEHNMAAMVLAKAPLKRIGEPDDVAAMVAFLASDDARMITGSCLMVDAGTVRAI